LTGRPLQLFLATVKSKENYLISPSGKEISVLHPKPEDITLPDIGLGLATEYRFKRRTVFPYTVAQHSWSVATLLRQSPAVPDDRKLLLARAGLLHDASEAYIGDIIKPLKTVLPDYQKIEDAWMRAVFSRFNLPFELLSDDLLKEADYVAYAVEVSALVPNSKVYGFAKRDLARLVSTAMKHSADAWLDTPRPWNDTMSANRFLDLAKELGLS
jgi:5'-deoxynucleotidase YfbR-like HD superfamily hydrolase